MALQTMIDRLRESQKQLSASARTEIATALSKLLPEGGKITWDQYTDYWNDGEACTFSVHEWTLHTKEGERIESYGYGYQPARLAHENTISAITEAWRLFDRNEELFQSAFGDHVTVTVLADGSYSTEDCDHE